VARLLIRGGRVLDPSAEIDDVLDVLVADGLIEAVGTNLDSLGAEVFDAQGCWVAPGFIDLHTHLR